MKRLKLTNFSIRYSWFVLGIVGVITVFFAMQFPKVHFDNDPENMLSENELVRVFHHQVKEKFSLYDFVIVGIVNEDHPDGIFNVKTLQRIDTLTSQILSMRRGADGLPELLGSESDAEMVPIDLRPTSTFKRIMNVAFRHNPNQLFDAEGQSVIISRELISPSVVDNIKQANQGSLKLEYLMEHVPTTREEALVIRDDALNNPLYSGTLVSEDGKAICVYIPISAKSYSYNVATLVRSLTSEWGDGDEVYITGLPVAEDTFGVEMLVQMAISAPLAMLILFLLMFMFFRRVSLIIAPLLLSVVAVIWTMGLLIGLGFDVHIMSSMIPIFIMPITVCNSIHLLSEFFDSFYKYNDKAETLRHVVRELFMPMLYATATTIAGFASLATTPIPPVKVFGLHVAFGVAVGWLLTMTFVPAFIMLFISQKSLHRLCRSAESEEACEVRPTWLTRFLRGIGSLTRRRYRAVVWASIAVMLFSVWGIMLIKVNDNPVKWFTKNHEIRVADHVLNSHFGGTYTAYLTFNAGTEDLLTCREASSVIREEAEKRFKDTLPEETADYLAFLDGLSERYCNVKTCNPKECLVELVNKATSLDEQAGRSWNNLADAVNYLEAEGLTFTSLVAQIETTQDVKAEDKQKLADTLRKDKDVSGSELIDKALAICDEYTALSFREFTFDMEAQISAPAFKRPEVLRYIEGLQQHLLKGGIVGKTSSAVDALKKASYELNFSEVPDDATDEEKESIRARNEANFSIPDTPSAVGQVFIQLEGMKKKDTLFHLVTRDYREANIWVQLKSGDNQDMVSVLADVESYIAEHAPPVQLDTQWAGLTYLNVVWQDKMVKGMMSSLISSFVVVLIMMLVLFRSGFFGILAMIPLTVTITFIYGLIGWAGKDYDMPVAILSAMTLGLSVDFAIHFLERSRELVKKVGSWSKASTMMFAEPAKAISRNAIVIALGFTPLLFAPLVPYRTVGLFLALIMLVSWLATLLILPALVTILEKRLFSSTQLQRVTEDNEEGDN